MPQSRSLVLSPKLHLPLEAITETFGIFGQKGSGKSSTSALFVEQGVRVGGRFVIIDPTGAWWGLMHAGTGPGLPGIVFGGEHADLPLEATAGHVVAEFVVGQFAYPVVVLDLSLMRKAGRVQFVGDFMATLYEENREAIHVVIDESPQFAPTQTREGGFTITTLGAVEDVVALGRKKGIGITMIAQRFAMLNANVREQIGTLLVHRIIGNLDRDAFSKWLEANGDPALLKVLMGGIAKAKAGTAVVFSPAFLEVADSFAMNMPTTFDSRATPKVGQRVKTPGKRADVNLDVLRERMAATFEEAEAKDPTKLREKLAKAETLLERYRISDEGQKTRILELEAAAQEYVEPERVEVMVIDREVAEEIARLVRGVFESQKASIDAFGALREVLDPVNSNLLEISREQARAGSTPEARALVDSISGKTRPAQPGPPPAAARPTAGAAVREGGASASNGSLGGAARNLLEVLVRHHPMRMSPARLAVLARRKPRGGSWNTAMRELRDGGYLAEAGGLLTPTEHGIAESGIEVGSPLTPEEVIGQWRGILPTAAREVFDVLVVAYPNAVPPDVVAERLGRQPRGGSWNTALKTLTDGGVATKTSEGLRASDDLFPGRSR